jgi:hypothetical protein
MMGVVSVTIHVTRVAIGQARLELAAGMLARATSYWVASLSLAAGRARLHVRMRVSRGGGQTESAVQTRAGLDVLAAHDLGVGLPARVPCRQIRVRGGWG